MNQGQADKTTPLTEQQARSLAYWWGGEYREIPAAGAGQGTRHGVAYTGPCCSSGEAPEPILILSLEEAQALEGRRGFQEACSPDWVG